MRAGHRIPGQVPGSSMRRIRPPPAATRVVYPFARRNCGGATVVGAQLASAFAARDGWDVRVVSHARGTAWEFLTKSNLPVEVVDGPPDLGFSDDESRWVRGPRLLPLYVAAERYLKRTDIDLVHCHDGMVAVSWGAAAKRRGIPVVWHIHQPKAQRSLDRLRLAFTSHLIFVADGTRGRFADMPGLPANRTIYNGLDLGSFTPVDDRPSARRLMGLTADRPVVGFVGNLVSRKRPHWAVDASISLHARGVDHDLVIIGDDYSGGRIAARLRTMVAAAGLQDRIHLLGRREDVPQLMPTFDALVLTSEIEAHPLVVIEAMAAGVPVVATAVGGVPEVIRPGVNGMLVPPDDLGGIVDSLQQVLSTPVRAAELRRAALSDARDRFSITTTIAQVQDVYEALLTAPTS